MDKGKEKEILIGEEQNKDPIVLSENVVWFPAEQKKD